MNTRTSVFSLAILGAVSLTILTPLLAHTHNEAAPSTVVCEDDDIAGGVTWRVKIEVHAVRNDNGQEIPRDKSADIGRWHLQCLQHASVAHHQGDKVHKGVCLSGDACDAWEGGGQAKVLTPGPYHCHVIGGNIICHEY